MDPVGEKASAFTVAPSDRLAVSDRPCLVADRFAVSQSRIVP